MGVPENHPAIQQALQRGLIPGTVSQPKAKRAKPALVEASFTPPGTWVVPLHVTAGDNNRGKAKIGRAAHERRVVSRCLGGPALTHLALWADVVARGHMIRVTLTRLSERALDDDNATSSMKYVRDTIALMMGFDDGANSPLRFEVRQEQSRVSGVRIEISTLLQAAT